MSLTMLPLQVDTFATTSPSPPRPTLAQCSQDHKFDIQNIPPFSM